jgi:hypothetical protein
LCHIEFDAGSHVQHERIHRTFHYQQKRSTAEDVPCPSQSMIAHWGRRSVKTQSDSLVFRGHVTKSISGKGIERPEVRRRFLYV